MPACGCVSLVPTGRTPQLRRLALEGPPTALEDFLAALDAPRLADLALRTHDVHGAAALEPVAALSRAAASYPGVRRLAIAVRRTLPTCARDPATATVCALLEPLFALGNLAVLEVLHALLGWVRSPLATTLIQVSSRLYLVWGVTHMFPQVCLWI